MQKSKKEHTTLKSFEVFTEMNVQNVVFCVVIPCSLLGKYRCSSEIMVSVYETTWSHNQDNHNLTILILSALVCCITGI
jgi:hypothetical protein